MRSTQTLALLATRSPVQRTPRKSASSSSSERDEHRKHMADTRCRSHPVPTDHEKRQCNVLLFSSNLRVLLKSCIGNRKRLCLGIMVIMMMMMMEKDLHWQGREGDGSYGTFLIMKTIELVFFFFDFKQTINLT